MSRPLRIEYAGALMHVTSRGNERKPIYRNDADFQLFLNTLSEVCDQFNWVIHSFENRGQVFLCAYSIVVYFLALLNEMQDLPSHKN